MPTVLKPPEADTILDLLLDAICVVDRDGRYVYVSAGFERIFGYRPDEVLGRPMIDLVHPDDRARTLQAASEIMAGQPKPHFQNRYLRKDGQVVHIMWAARWSERDGVRIAMARDITELKRAEAMQAALLAISEAAHATGDLQALFARIHAIVGELLPADNCFVALKDGERGMLEFPYFVDEHDPPPGPMPIEAPTLTGEVVRGERPLLLTPETLAELHERLQPSVGHEALDWLGVPLRGPGGVIGALVVQSYSGAVRYRERDMVLLQFVSTQVAAAIERKRDQARLQYLADHDALTGLANRKHFHERLEAQLRHAGRDGDRFALLYLDLDGFKQVNDRYGHDAGDRLLREAARRLRGCVRASDLVARLGGDEFVAMLPGVVDAGHAAAVADAVRAALQQPFVLDAETIWVGASIGIVLHPQHGDRREPLLRRADRAMYDAKRRGGGCFVLHPGDT